jgi:hypothetical protein
MKWTMAIGFACAVSSAAGCSTESLQTARTEANTASAIASLRIIASAQITYSAVCAGGLYSPTLKTLGVPGTGSTDAFISPDLTSDPSRKSGYTITLVAGPPVADAPATCNGLGAGLAVRDFFASAEPADGARAPYLALISTGVVYKSTEPIRPVFGVAPPPPAVPIQ